MRQTGVLKALSITIISILITALVIGLCLIFLLFNFDPCANLPIVSREGWGARPTKSSSALNPANVRYAFIHHTFIPSACHTKEDCIKKVQQVQNMHMDNNGWDDIGYSFMIGEDGNVYEARGWDRVGAHTYAYNSVGLGFSIIGDFMNTLPSEPTLRLVKRLIACGVAKGKLPSNYTLRGHRDMKATACPGQALYDEIRSWLHYTM